MVTRIRQLMEFKEQTMAQFADGIEVPRAVLSHILTGRNKPSLDVVLKLVGVHQDVSLNWLLLGEGEMLKQVAQANESLTTDVATEKLNGSIVEDEGKVQKGLSDDALPLPHSSHEKKVKQIVFFYTDNTFETFYP